jgi:acetyl esterase/lipase
MQNRTRDHNPGTALPLKTSVLQRFCSSALWYLACCRHVGGTGDVCLLRRCVEGREMSDGLRFGGGLTLLGLASLTAVPAPTHLLWAMSVMSTEWGYWLAIAAIIPLIPWRNSTKLGRLGAIFSVGAIALFIVPVLRAHEMNNDLPAAFTERFGAERRERTHYSESTRQAPLVLRDLLKPVPLPAVRFEERVFGKRDGASLTLDIYQPGYDHGPLPGVIVVHGGDWQSGGNAEFLALNAYLAGRDYVVAAINYRFAARFPFPAGRDDVLAAIAYLKVYASEIGVDPTRLVLLGRSSGAQLALLTAYTANEPAIKGAISLYGPTDMRAQYDQPGFKGVFDTRHALETYLGGPPSKADDAYFAASPVNFVTSTSPATLLIHGMRDTIVPVDQSAELDGKLEQVGVKHLFIKLPWATHGCDKTFGGPCGQVATYAVERFLDAVTIDETPEPPAPPVKQAKIRAQRTPKTMAAK